MSIKDPAFLMYSQDFLIGVIDLTMEERGQYITLLCLQHQKGKLSKKLIDVSVPNVSEFVLEKFDIDENGFYYNKRLEEETQKRNKYCESRKKNSQSGGRPKKEIVLQRDWEEMCEFFENRCIKCGSECIGSPTIDHIIPRTLGGKDEITNYQPMCRECNSSKHNNNSIDYRLNFYDKIPQNLKDKWFGKNHEKTIWFTYENHTENVNENKNININELVNRVIDYLNTKCKTRYKANTNDVKKHLIARINEGYTYEDFVKVIDIKYAEWKGTEFEKFLRPATLFGSKFQSYLNQPVKETSYGDADSFFEMAVKRTYEDEEDE